MKNNTCTALIPRDPKTPPIRALEGDGPTNSDPGQPMKALSIRQPWAWLILHAGKDIENRNWKTHFRGRVLIHASQRMSKDEWLDGLEMVLIQHGVRHRFPGPEFLQRGGIVGSVEIVDCVANSTSPWFHGDYGFVLRDPRPLPFRPCRGSLNFFTPKFDLATP